MSAARSMLAAATACAATVAECVSIGTDALRVEIDSTTGRLAGIESQGRTLLADDPGLPSPLVFDGADIRAQSDVPWSCAGVRAADEQTAVVEWTFGPWRGSMEWEVHPDNRMVRLSFAFEWTGDEAVRLHGFEVFHGKMRCPGGRGRYLLPGRFPPLSRSAAEFLDGHVEEGAICTPMAIGDNGESSVMVAVNELVPYADYSIPRVIEREDGFSLTTRFETAGWMRKGVPQRVGDVWLCFRDGDAEENLRNTGDWFRKVGMLPPPDRPPWMESLSLYSMHPCGHAEDNFSDRDGLALSARYLPFLEALGVNCIWMRPIEDQSPYVPRDYFAFQPGVGTADDLRAYVAAAHTLGIRVWRDAVVHGGRADSPRAKAHPEWLAWREDGRPDHVWTYDYSHPGWVAAFSNIVGSLTRDYDLDGWRIDVASGSRGPNWNPDAASMRGSSARCQGGIAQQRAIRAASRAESPDSATLAESTFASSACASDAIYDYPPNLVWFFRFTDTETVECVRNIRRFLHEQQCAMPPGALLMHYEENHDTLPAPLLFGRAAANALFAMTAWIRGFPLVPDEGEDGCFETWRGILRTRREVPELTRGTCDYDGVAAPDGVFACLREFAENASLVLVNFNGRRVQGAVSYPGGTTDIDLAPFGYEVRRIRGAPLPPCAPVPPFHADAGEIASVRQQEVAVTLRSGAPAPEGCHIVSEPLPSGGVRHRVVDLGGLDATNVQLVVRMPSAERWFAHAADGDFESPFLVRHPGWDKVDSQLFHRPREGAMRWRSSLHPFGFTPDRACVGGVFADGSAAVLRGVDSGKAEVLVLDRVGAEPGLAIAIRSDAIDGLSCETLFPKIATVIEQTDLFAADAAHDFANAVRREQISLFSSALSASPREETSSLTGIPELATVMAGWEWESGNLRVRIQRNGTLRGVWRRDGPDAPWRRILAEASIETDTGSGRRAMFGGAGSRECKQSLEFDCPMSFWREPDGTVHLDFGPGDLRQYGRSAMMVSPVWFRTRYTLRPGDDSFRLESAVSAERAFAAGEGTLALRMDFDDEEPGRHVAEWSSFGAEPHVLDEGDRRFYRWLTPATTFEPQPGTWHGVRMRIQ